MRRAILNPGAAPPAEWHQPGRINLTRLQANLRQFAAKRNWQRLQPPKNLAMALRVEAAERAEIFQRMTAEQSQAA